MPLRRAIKVTPLLQGPILADPFVSYSENIDTSSPMGKAMFTIVSAIAELEHAIIKERVTGRRAACDH